MAHNGCDLAGEFLSRLLLLIVELLLTHWLRAEPGDENAPGRDLAHGRRATRGYRDGTWG